MNKFTHGIVVGKDAYGRDIKVGDLVDDYEWYGLEMRVTRQLVIGLTAEKGNFRTVGAHIDADTGVFCGWVSWLHFNKALIAPKELMDKTNENKGYYQWMNDYMIAGQPENLFNSFIEKRFDVRSIKQYKLEV